MSVDPVNHTHFHNIFRSEVDDITEGFSTIQYASENVHWAKWATFCRDESLKYLLILYSYPVPTLNDFLWQYRTEKLHAANVNYDPAQLRMPHG